MCFVGSLAVVLAQHPQNDTAEWEEHTSQRLQALALRCVPPILNFVARSAGAAMHRVLQRLNEKTCRAINN